MNLAKTGRNFNLRILESDLERLRLAAKAKGLSMQEVARTAMLDRLDAMEDAGELSGEAAGQ